MENDWGSLLKSEPSPVAPRTRQPPVRYFTLRDILEYSEDDPEIVEAKKAIEGYDKVLKILSRRKEGGYWELADQPYTPKYRSTYWVFMVLSQLGLDVRNRQVREACDFIKRFQREDGGFAIYNEASAGDEYMFKEAEALRRGVAPPTMIQRLGASSGGAS